MKAALIFAVCLAAGPALADCPAGASETTTVAEVMDGVTMRLSDGGEVRLAGIEPPPRPLDLAPSAFWPPGEQAGGGLARLVQDQTIALAAAGDGPDRYGRPHAYAFLPDGRSVAEVLLGEGLVRARWWPEENGCFVRFLAAEAAAREAKRGLWGLPEFAAQAADDPSLARRNGLYALVEGRVVSVGHGQRMVFLDFGADIRRDFTVMVAPAVADALSASGRPMDGFSGQRVRVRGVIEESNGPAIRLNDPAEIELLKGDDAGASR